MHLADPTTLQPFNAEGLVQVVVETPRNSRNKYSYDPARRVLVLKKMLPLGMIFPFDFGLVPSTRAGDDDPIDVLLLIDEPAVPGCVVDSRLIGVIRGENQRPDGSRYRNDRLLAVAELSQQFAAVRHIRDLPSPTLDHMASFFQDYPRLLGGKPYYVLGIDGPDEAHALLAEACRNYVP